jgi:hypothetical protein
MLVVMFVELSGFAGSTSWKMVGSEALLCSSGLDEVRPIGAAGVETLFVWVAVCGRVDGVGVYAEAETLLLLRRCQ